MAAVYLSPCRIFPGEVEDYYCTGCHTTCSGLSLLVGPHTGHSCIPLLQAAKYLPTTLHRDAHALVTQIQDEYVHPKTAQCTTLHSTLSYMQRERERKQKELEVLQRELRLLDDKIDGITQECALALCYWSHRRQDFVSKAQRLLHGADVLSKTIGLREGTAESCKRNTSARGAASTGDISPSALQAIKKELREMRQLLTQSLKWLEADEEKEEETIEKNQQQRSRHATGGVDVEFFLSGEAEKKTTYRWRPRGVKESLRGGGDSGSGGNDCNDSSDVMMSSDATAVLQRLLEAQEKPRTPPRARESSPAHLSTDEEETDEARSCDARDEEQTRAEQRRWRHDVGLREQMLHEGLNRCLYGDTYGKQTKSATAMTLLSDETDINDISGSSGSRSGSVNEAVTQLLRGQRRGESANMVLLSTSPFSV